MPEGERTRARHRAALLAVLLLLCAGESPADNGRVAWAFPADITVDGDLSDWPDGLPSYAVELAEFGHEPDGPHDLSATMRVAHGPGQLFIAVQVTDQSIVLGETSRFDYEAADGLEVYICSPDTEGLSMQEALYGDSRYSLDGRARDSEPVATFVRRVRDAGFDYEVAVDLRRVLGPDSTPQPYSSLPFDLVVVDRDADGSFTWLAWGPFMSKVGDSTRQGDVLFVEQPVDAARAVEVTSALQSRSVVDVGNEISRYTTYQVVFSSVLVTVAGMHLLLLLFGVQRRANLFYALTALTAAAFVYVVMMTGARLSAPAWINELVPVLGYVAPPLVGVLYLQFLYAFFELATPRLFWVIPGVWLPTVGVAMAQLLTRQDAFLAGPGLGILLVLLATFAEIVRVLIVALRRRLAGSRMIALGTGAFVGTGVLTNFLLAEPDISISLGFLAPVIAVSVYLARSVAYTSRQLEAQNLRLAQANRRIEEATQNKSQFLRRMAHDLRSPLNAIVGYTRLVLRKGRDALDDRQVRNLENIETSSNNLLDLVSEILDLSRIEAGRLEVNLQPVDLRALAGECADALASIVPQGVVLRRELDDVGLIQADAKGLRKVVMNLLGNATKFTEAGLITLSLKRSDDDAVELAVADTGIGIPPDDLPHIFDEFRQVERKAGNGAEGSGLGLAIAKKTVELLGGEIRVASTVGEGTTFTVRLAQPRSHDTAAKPRRPGG